RFARPEDRLAPPELHRTHALGQGREVVGMQGREQRHLLHQGDALVNEAFPVQGTLGFGGHRHHYRRLSEPRRRRPLQETCPPQGRGIAWMFTVTASVEGPSPASVVHVLIRSSASRQTVSSGGDRSGTARRTRKVVAS